MKILRGLEFKGLNYDVNWIGYLIFFNFNFGIK